MTAPRDHHAFVLDKTICISNRHDFEAHDDVQAVQIARKYVNGHDVEVWELGRVGRLKNRE